MFYARNMVVVDQSGFGGWEIEMLVKEAGVAQSTLNFVMIDISKSI